MENFKPFVMSEFPIKTFVLMSVVSYQFQFVVLAKFGIFLMPSIWLNINIRLMESKKLLINFCIMMPAVKKKNRFPY